jgi:hypothetical protein
MISTMSSYKVITYDGKVLLSLRSELHLPLLHFVGGQTEVDEVVVLNILWLLEVQLSSLQVIIGVL